MHRRATQQSISWPQVSVLPSLKKPGLGVRSMRAGFCLERFEVQNKIEGRYRDFPLSPVPAQHSLPHCHHPEVVPCYSRGAHMDTSSPPRVQGLRWVRSWAFCGFGRWITICTHHCGLTQWFPALHALCALPAHVLFSAPAATDLAPTAWPSPLGLWLDSHRNSLPLAASLRDLQRRSLLCPQVCSAE